MSTFAVRGLSFFLTHPRLWRLAVAPLLLMVAVGVGSTIALLVAALYPQAEGLEDAGVTPWLAWLLALMLVFVESFVVTLLFSLVCLACFQDRVFAYVLRKRGFAQLVDDRARHASFVRIFTSCCRVSILLRLGLLVVSVPLNVVPVAGNALYAWLNGKLVAWEYHLFYFELKNLSFEQQEALMRERDWQYTLFGMQALLLEMIPGFGAVFMFTNTVGAALFAASIEEDEAKATERQRAAPLLSTGAVNRYLALQ